MPIYAIYNFDDIRFVRYIMLEGRLIKLTKDFFASLSYWTEEIRIHKFANKGLEYIAGVIMYCWLALKKLDFMELTLQKIIN